MTAYPHHVQIKISELIDMTSELSCYKLKLNNSRIISFDILQIISERKVCIVEGAHGLYGENMSFSHTIDIFLRICFRIVFPIIMCASYMC
jgi:hypothetical protein